jgi:hypothetical protein
MFGVALRVKDHLYSIDFNEIKNVEAFNNLFKVGLKDRYQIGISNVSC